MSGASGAPAGAARGYTAVGHVTIDVMPDGSRRAGGAAFYSALQAARLGLRARVLTQGRPSEIEAALEPYRGELELDILAAPRTTTLAGTGSGSERKQRVLAWAGPMPEDLELDDDILHLAPVARECPRSWRGRSRFVGLTPQGLLRTWRAEGDEFSLQAPADVGDLARRADAIVVSEHERSSCAALLTDARRAGAVVAVTAGRRPCTLLPPKGAAIELPVPPVAGVLDDLGAGDVFAAAFFIALAGGRSPVAAASFANAAAAVRVRGEGAGAIGDRASIEGRMRESAAGD